MKSSLTLLSSIFLACTMSVNAANITLKKEQEFELKASYYKSTSKSDRAVLLLHQCNYNRTMYNNIGEQLASKGIHALSLDFRGFGESVSEEFNIDKVQALPQEERRPAWRAMAANWSKDVQLAHDHLKSKLPKSGKVGVIGASCGGSQAITLSENNPIEVIGFFSSGQRDANITRYTNVMADKPTLIIASEEDTGTYASAQKLFKATTNENSKFIAYKGGDHGYPLLDRDAQLASYIVGWLDSQIK